YMNSYPGLGERQPNAAPQHEVFRLRVGLDQEHGIASPVHALTVENIVNVVVALELLDLRDLGNRVVDPRGATAPTAARAVYAEHTCIELIVRLPPPVHLYEVFVAARDAEGGQAPSIHVLQHAEAAGFDLVLGREREFGGESADHALSDITHGFFVEANHHQFSPDGIVSLIILFQHYS